MRRTPVRVLIVDDSPTALAVLGRVISAEPDLVLVGSVLGGDEALRLIPGASPDVVCVDLVMPGMDGVVLANEIVTRFRVPVLMMSSQVDPSRQDVVDRSLGAGALAFVEKPQLSRLSTGSPETRRFVNRIRVVAGVVVIGKRVNAAHPGLSRVVPRLVAIGASAGGPPALLTLLSALPPSFPMPILAAQHMMAGFEGGFRDWLQSELPLPVWVAERGAIPAPGQVYVAPADSHLEIGAGMRLAVTRRESAEELCPSVNRLFASAARSLGAAAVGVLLSGMGTDGADGLARLKSAGSRTIAQSEASSAVWGMPGAAVALGAVEQQLSPEEIGAELMRLVSEGAS